MGTGSSGAAEARRAQRAEEDRERRIREGTATIRNKFATSFNDKYFADLEKSAKDFYTPQVDKQFADAVKQMQYALARTGNLNSSAAANRMTGANEEYRTAMAGVGEQARGLANQRRGDVANAETVAVNQLISSGDNVAAAIQAQNQIAANTALPAFSPLGQVFTNLSAGLATQADLERQGQNRYNVFGRIPGWNNSNRYTTTVR